MKAGGFGSPVLAHIQSTTDVRETGWKTKIILYRFICCSKLHVVFVCERETIVCHVHTDFSHVFFGVLSFAVNAYQFRCLHAVQFMLRPLFKKRYKWRKKNEIYNKTTSRHSRREQEHTSNLFNILLRMSYIFNSYLSTLAAQLPFFFLFLIVLFHFQFGLIWCVRASALEILLRLSLQSDLKQIFGNKTNETTEKYYCIAKNVTEICSKSDFIWKRTSFDFSLSLSKTCLVVSQQNNGLLIAISL